MNFEAIYGAVAGCIAGDSLGLKFEGLSPRRAEKMYNCPEKQYFIFGKRIISDDTEHLLFTLYALYKSEGDETLFKKYLASYLKNWFLSLPYGIGFATLKASIKLLLGVSPDKSGVMSAGNGPAMRSGIIGIFFGSDISKLKNMVKISTVLTHKDKKAETGALIIAYAAYLSSIKADINPEIFIQDFSAKFSENLDLDIKNRFEFIIDSIKNGESTYEYCSRRFNNKGVSGYIYNSCEAVIHCWLTYKNDFKKAILEIIKCGGDTDTTAAILGTIIAAGNSSDSIPENWIDNSISFPFSIEYMKDLSTATSDKFNALNIDNSTSEFMYSTEIKSIKKPSNLLLLFRNLLFYPIIILYGFRRLLPPW